MLLMRTLAWLLGLSLLAFQVGAIVYARFVPARYFCWAPYDMQTKYQLHVTVNGKQLTDKDIAQRYRRPQNGIDNRSVQHVIDIIELTEQRYHSADSTEVVMTYTINGKKEERWVYGQP
jgi:hypothetical protein